MLLAARVDPAGMIAFFDMLQREEGRAGLALAYLSSHPPAADRVARLRSIAAGLEGNARAPPRHRGLAGPRGALLNPVRVSVWPEPAESRGPRVRLGRRGGEHGCATAGGVSALHSDWKTL